MTSKQFAIQYCKQNGIPEEQVMQVAKMLGLKQFEYFVILANVDYASVT